MTRFGIKRSEGQLLRYLTDCYKTLIQTVPSAHLTDDLEDVIEWLGAMIRRVDSSLIDEWERLRDPDIVEVEPTQPVDFDITANERAFSVLVRNELFRTVTSLATRRQITPEIEGIEAYFSAHEAIEIDADARSSRWVVIDLQRGLATQTLCDPERYMEWVLEAEIDLAASRLEDRAVVTPIRVKQL